MIFEALLASVVIAVASLSGALLFGHDKRLIGLERFVIPMAVGVFLSLVLMELIPETIESAPTYGSLVIAFGFLAFYVLANSLHQKFHAAAHEDCHRKSAATLILVGDSIHNLSDGFILGTAFLVDPTVGVAVAIGLLLHEVPQEIVEFGVLIRAGYTRMQAALYNLISASSIVVGTLIVLLVSEHIGEYSWILIAFAAGNLLYLATSELLPRIHENLPHYKSIWHSVTAIVIGFVVMSAILTWAHEQYGAHGHSHLEDVHHEHYDEHHEEGDEHFDAEHLLEEDEHHDEVVQ